MDLRSTCLGKISRGRGKVPGIRAVASSRDQNSYVHSTDRTASSPRPRTSMVTYRPLSKKQTKQAPGGEQCGKVRDWMSRSRKSDRSRHRQSNQQGLPGSGEISYRQLSFFRKGLRLAVEIFDPCSLDLCKRQVSDELDPGI